jgi:hypothetical protein
MLQIMLYELYFNILEYEMLSNFLRNMNAYDSKIHHANYCILYLKINKYKSLSCL